MEPAISRLPFATKSAARQQLVLVLSPRPGKHSLGGRFDAEAWSAGVGGASAHAPIRPGYVIAIGRPLLPVAPLIGAGVKQ
jgi:hypothetical protein